MKDNLNAALETPSADFERRLLAHVDALFNRALDLCDSPDEACELVVETCVRAWRGFRNEGPRVPGKAWLFAIMFSIASNERPHGRRTPELGATFVPERGISREYESVLADSSVRQIREASPELSEDEVLQVLNELPEELRIPVVLVDIDQLTYEDAARILRCSVGSLQSRLFHSRRALFVKLSRIVKDRHHSGRIGLS